MNKQRWCAFAHQAKVIGVVRAPSYELGIAMATAIAQGGITLIEITWNSAHPERLIETLRATLPACLIGTGTVLTQQDVKRAILAGAQFCFSPHGDPALIEYARLSDIPFIPGALTPSEIVTAWQAGAASVKVFPIASVGGAAYLKALSGPLGHIPLIPTGGVTCLNAETFLKAGAIAVGLSSDLFPPQAVQTQDWTAITQGADQLCRRLTAISPVGL